MKKIIIYCLLSFFTISSSFAIEGVGYGIRGTLSGKIYKRFSFFFEEDVRFGNQMNPEWFLTTAEINYKIMPKYLVGGVGYMSFIQYQGAKEVRNRYYLYLTGSYALGNFRFFLRERFQSIYTVGKSGSSDALRSRLQITYPIKNSGFTPYVYIEAFNNLKKKMRMDKLRYAIGCTYKIDKHNGIDLYYRYHTFADGYYDTVNHLHNLNLGYSYTF
ncbi:MAG: DUF2490 domain-containing protein [Parabacteroides sp.]|nr:DUF2490 domain-containing protein [Parabacteroides sp.]